MDRQTHLQTDWQRDIILDNYYLYDDNSIFGQLYEMSVAKCQLNLELGERGGYRIFPGGGETRIGENPTSYKIKMKKL